MNKLNSDSIQILSFGLSFKNNYKILDCWGNIADEMLDCKEFGTKYFPQISSQYTVERQLLDMQTGNYLKLTADNLILRHKISKNFDEEYQMFKTRIINVIIPKIVNKYNLITRRLGMVYTLSLSEEEINKFSSLYFKPGVSCITDFRFSRKEATPKGLTFANNDNYINKLFTVGAIDEDQTGIIYDYQLYYLPIQPEIRGDISKFFETSYIGFEKDVLQTIKNNEG